MSWFNRRVRNEKKKCPDFFLSAAAEMTGDLETTRSCWAKARLRDDFRDDYMLIEVAPPAVEGGPETTELLISTRHKGPSLFPLKELPIDVYITRILDRSISGTLVFNKSQVQLIGWGRLFRSAEESDLEREKYRRMNSPRGL